MDTARAVTAGTKGVPRAERESQIVAAAIEEFGRHGYAGASMAAIAARVGVTKPLLYQYFGSKDRLHIAALEHVAGLLTPAITRALNPGAGTLDVPLAVLEAIFTTLEGRRHAWFVLFDRTLPPDGELRRTARYHRDVIDRLAASGSAELLRSRGIDDEVDADALKHLWTGAVSSLVSWWNAHPEESAENMARRCARLFAAVVG